MTLSILSVLSFASVINLDAANWDQLVIESGKNAFVKFYAPWCGHCKKLKPVWDDLGNSFDSGDSVLIGDVDCTNEQNKDLCKRYDVKGYPTLKHIFAGMVEDYNGGRDMQDLKKFAQGLKPLCTPSHLERCDAKQKKFIETVSTQDAAEREAQLKRMKEDIAKRDAELDTLLKTLRETYETEVTALEKYKKSMQFEMSTLEAVKDVESRMDSKEEL